MQELKGLIERAAYKLSQRSRKRKFSQFLREIKPAIDETILDVGVNDMEYSETDNYLEKHYFKPENITAVSKDGVELFEKRYPKIKSLVADGRSLPFPDNSFDISYSNAVLEHVGDSNDQVNFLKEIFRVSRRGYITTPNRCFPLEIHTRLPLLHLILPKKFFDNFLKWIGKGWAAGDYMNLLSKKELKIRLEEAGIKKYDIHSNRLFGLVATFSVTWKK